MSFWGQQTGPSSLNTPICLYRNSRTTVRNYRAIMSTQLEFTHAHMHTQPRVHTGSLVKMVDASHPLLRPERCSWSGDSEGASRGAVWASLPAPDNFTIPALAGGDNHIKLPWQEALNSASLPLRVWHPAVSPEDAADVTMRRFVFSFFYSVASLFFFPPPFFSRRSPWNVFRNDLGCHVMRKSELAELSVTAIALTVRSVIVLVPCVSHGEFYTISSFCRTVLRDIFEKFSRDISFSCMSFGISVDCVLQ